MSLGRHYMIYQTHDIYKFIDWWYAEPKPSVRPPAAEWEDGYLDSTNDVSVALQHLHRHYHGCNPSHGNYFAITIEREESPPDFFFFWRNLEGKFHPYDDDGKIGTYITKKLKKETPALITAPPETTKLNQELPNGAVRANSDKTRLSLVPPIPVEEIGRVFTYGAKKYSRAIDYDSSSMLSYAKGELESCNVLLAQALLLEHGECVVTAMTKTLGSEIQIMLHDNEKTKRIGRSETPMHLKNISSDAEQILKHLLETEPRKNELNWQKSVFQKLPLLYFLQNRLIAVESVSEISLNAPVTLITIIKLGSQEAIFVVGATTVWECWATTWTAYQRQLSTYSIAQLPSLQIQASLTKDLKLTISGANNWNKGFPWLSVYDSLLRHLSAWHQGQDIDPESGLLHLAHAGCNLMMLIDFHKNNIGVDNRWRYNDSSSPSTDNS